MNTPTPIENPPAMTAEQIAKLVAQCREDLAVMPENNGFRNFRIAKLAPALCNALEAAQKENAELSRRLEAAKKVFRAIPHHQIMDAKERSGEKLQHMAKCALETLNQPLP